MACKYWQCIAEGQTGECEEAGGECIGDMCERFQECRSCDKQDGEDCPKY